MVLIIRDAADRLQIPHTHRRLSTVELGQYSDGSPVNQGNNIRTVGVTSVL